jgi:hypothetical protein
MAIGNITMLDKTINGPGGSTRNRDNNIPKDTLITPKRALDRAYLDRVELTLFATAAGTTTKKPTRSVPTIFMLMATISDTRKR